MSYEEEVTKRTAWFSVCCAAFIITVMVLLFKTCEREDQLRMECVRAGRAPVECEDLFNGRRAK